MRINGEIVRRVGKQDRRFTYKCCRLERRGFLSIYSFEVSALPHRHDLMDRGHAVVVLPADFARREIVMIEQPRHLKAFAETDEGARALDAARRGEGEAEFALDAERVLQLELPAGMIDRGETPAEAASRELREETGLVVAPGDLDEVATYYLSLGGSTERITAFIARLDGATPSAEADGDGNEQITVWKVPFEEAWRQMGPGGRIGTASSMVLLRELRIRDLEAW
jgi:nudix-type nucleoside diphosphatase (YffH/AdpP family)